MADQPWDLAILGAGCAGLSLASRLAGSGMRCCLIDPRPDPAQDRAFDRHWGYWRIEPHPFEHLEIARWSRWKLRFGGQEHTLSSTRYPYCLIPSEALVGEAMGRVRAASNVELLQGAVAHKEMPSLEEMASLGRLGAFRLPLDDGRILAARHVADSRPPRLTGPPANILLRQHFLGQWVRLPDGRFDPDVVTLMDFDLDQSQGIHFAYLLPLGPDHALVIDTFFGPAPLAAEVYRGHIADYLRGRFGVARFEVEREEIGVIPMTTQPLPVQSVPGWFRIGGLGGAIKPSSGYAFTAIQRQVSRLSSSLLSEQRSGSAGASGPAALTPTLRSKGEGLSARPLPLEWLDRILLCRMHDRPESIPGLLFRLFERVEPDALVRFLSDRPEPGDYFDVIRAMPPLPLIHTALRRMPQWLHR